MEHHKKELKRTEVNGCEIKSNPFTTLVLVQLKSCSNFDKCILKLIAIFQYNDYKI